MKSDTILVDGECAIRHLRGPEEAGGKDSSVEVVNLGSRTGIKEVNSYQDEGAVVMFAVCGHVFALEHPYIAGEIEAVAIGIRGRARKHGYACEAFEVRDGARLDVNPVIADGRWTREKKVDKTAEGRNHVAAGDRNRRDTRGRIGVPRGTRSE